MSSRDFQRYLKRAHELRDYADPAVGDEERGWRLEAAVEGAQASWEALTAEKRVEAAREHRELTDAVLRAARAVSGSPRLARALADSQDTAAVDALGAYVQRLLAWAIYAPSEEEYLRECGALVVALYVNLYGLGTSEPAQVGGA